MSEGIRLPKGGRIGPVLYFRGVDAAALRVVALIAVTAGSPVPRVEVPGGDATVALAAEALGWAIYLADMTLPAGTLASYAVDGDRFDVAVPGMGDLRLAFVSCNGQEHGDLDRAPETRNAMWARLGDDHAAAPFHLLMHGGDQIYADEATEAHPLSAGWPTRHANHVPEADRAGLRRALRDDFHARYLALYAQPAFARLAARVPSVAMWDDHDICDGWGSQKDRAQGSDVAPILFGVAREAYLLFQCGVAPGALSPLCHDRSGASLGFRAALPGVDVIAPDLRSERTLARVMGPEGWNATESMLSGAAGRRVIVISSVPALGPRLSLVERWMQRTPWLEKYEDDLRDQWQSHAHRAEWQRFLRALLQRIEAGQDVTVLSGEIHLATRATMRTGGAPLHQLVASGISHPPPPAIFPAVLGLLARFGEAPLAGHPIRLHPLPGQRAIYVAERNYLTLARRDGAWTARWHLEDSGVTAPLPI